MAVDRFKQFTSWSYSRYTDWFLCPLKAFLSHIKKHPLGGVKNDAMVRGADIHAKAEGYVTGKIAKLPKELVEFKALFAELRAQYKKGREQLVVEDSWAFTKDWTKTRWDDWANCWVRIKLDLARFHEGGTVLEVIDWKTGKFRADEINAYVEQLELYALGGLLLYPDVQVVRPKLCYTDLGFTYDGTFNGGKLLEFRRADLERLKKTWGRRVLPMMSDTVFAPKPNRFCGWCAFRKDNDGPCKY